MIKRRSASSSSAQCTETILASSSLWREYMKLAFQFTYRVYWVYPTQKCKNSLPRSMYHLNANSENPWNGNEARCHTKTSVKGPLLLRKGHRATDSIFALIRRTP